MKKNQIRGIIVIAVVLAAYLVLALLIPFTKNGMYWVGFIFGIIAIIVSAVGIITAFAREESARSRFYGFPVARLAAIYCYSRAGEIFIRYPGNKKETGKSCQA